MFDISIIESSIIILKSKKILNNKGFSHFELFLLLSVIVLITIVGLFVYSKNGNKSKADSLPTDSSSSASPAIDDQNITDNFPLPNRPLPKDTAATSASNPRLARQSTVASNQIQSTITTSFTGYGVSTERTSALIDYAFSLASGSKT
jgi:uncharacterized protein (UPF0333 family)